MQKIFLNFILFFSALFSVNSALALPLSSVIATDTQQVQYIEKRAQSSMLLLQIGVIDESNDQSIDILAYSNNHEAYLKKTIIYYRFYIPLKLFKQSLSRFESLITRQQHIIQKPLFQQILLAFQLRLIKHFAHSKNTQLNK